MTDRVPGGRPDPGTCRLFRVADDGGEKKLGLYLQRKDRGRHLQVERGIIENEETPVKSVKDRHVS